MEKSKIGDVVDKPGTTFEIIEYASFPGAKTILMTTTSAQLLSFDS